MMDVFIVDASSYDEVHDQLMKFKDSIKIVKTFQPRSPPVDTVGTSNGRVEQQSNYSAGTSTPPQPAPPPAPPAVSVVTFRWDDTIEPCENQRAR